MSIPLFQPRLRAAVQGVGRHDDGLLGYCLHMAFDGLSICSRNKQVLSNRRAFSQSGIRYASHKAQGAVNKAKDGPGKRLGAKKTGEQYVIPGNIIFRQRGTHWFPGDNCAMGRDHTIYATESGYVKYYKDPDKHPKRQYIGVTFERDQVLPLPRNAMRRRRLGMVAQRIEGMHTRAGVPNDEESNEVRVDIGSDASETNVLGGEAVATREAGQGASTVQSAFASGIGSKTMHTPASMTGGSVLPTNVTLRPGYMYRESNWQIGRAAELANVKVRQFKPGDRWVAWRKTAMRKAKNMERKGIGRTNKKK